MNSNLSGVRGGERVGVVGARASLVVGTSVMVAFAFQSAAFAQTAWTVIRLNPPMARSSNGYGTGSGQQAGYTALFAGGMNQIHASLWNGTAGSWIDLQPSGASESVAWGVQANQQVGYVSLAGGARRASLWSGTSASRVELHPNGALESEALGVCNGQQAGYTALVSGGMNQTRASLWNGTAASWVAASAFIIPPQTPARRQRTKRL